MEINEVRKGDMVTFTIKGKKKTGKVIHHHDTPELSGHVNVDIINKKKSEYPVTIHVSKLKPALHEDIFMEHHSNIFNLVDHINSGENLEAQEIFNSILQDKIALVLHDAKQIVAERMFHVEHCEDCDNEEVNEALKGKQHKIDANKNGKLDAQDFKLLRAKKSMKEDAELDEDDFITEEEYEALSDEEQSEYEYFELDEGEVKRINKAKKNAFITKQGKSKLIALARHGVNSDDKEKPWLKGKLALSANNIARDAANSPEMKRFGRRFTKFRKEDISYMDEGNAENKAKKNAYADNIGNKLGGKRPFKGSPMDIAGLEPNKYEPEYRRAGRSNLRKEDTSYVDAAMSTLDELSNDILNPYIAAARQDLVKRMSGKKMSLTDIKKAAKRAKGIKTAQGKLQNRSNVQDEFVYQDAEQIDELSKKVLKSYMKKAKTSGERAETRGQKEEDKSMSTDGMKYPAKQERHMRNAGVAYDIANKREKGMKMAQQKLASKKKQNEEVEQIDELSNDALNAYMAAARQDLVKRMNSKKMSLTDIKKANKRAKGIKTAGQRLRNEEVEQMEEGNAENKMKKRVFVSSQGRNLSAARENMKSSDPYRSSRTWTGRSWVPADSLAQTNKMKTTRSDKALAAHRKKQVEK